MAALCLKTAYNRNKYRIKKRNNLFYTTENYEIVELNRKGVV